MAGIISQAISHPLYAVKATAHFSLTMFVVRDQAFTPRTVLDVHHPAVVIKRLIKNDEAKKKESRARNYQPFVQESHQGGHFNGSS